MNGAAYFLATSSVACLSERHTRAMVDPPIDDLKELLSNVESI